MMFAFLVAIAMASRMAEDGSSADALLNQARGPASVLTRKQPLVMAEESLRHTEKIHGPVDAAIELVGDRPSQAGDVFLLKGLFTSTEAILDVDYKWSLPAGVELINGEVHGHIAALGPSSPVEVQLTLKTKTGEDHKISLMAGASHGGARFAASVHYSTLMEPVLEASRAELKATTQKKMRVLH